MNKKERCIIYPMLIILVTTVTILFSHGLPFESNAAGLLIGVFSALITLILGWQIYNALDMKEKIDKVTSESANNYAKLKDVDNEMFALSLFGTAQNFSATNNDALAAKTYLTILDAVLEVENLSQRLSITKDRALSRLRIISSIEILDCTSSEFSHYCRIAKAVGLKWLIDYVMTFVFFGDDNQKITSEQKEKLFDEV